jgi:hypothetical protein
MSMTNEHRPEPGHTFWERQLEKLRQMSTRDPAQALVAAPGTARRAYRALESERFGLGKHTRPTDHRVDALMYAMNWVDAPAPAPDPLDAVIDGMTLRELLAWDADARHEGWAGTRARRRFTPAQCAAVSAHWSADLRAKVEARRRDDAAAAVSIYVDAEHA